MIFRRDMVEKISEGKKTMTRRPVKYDKPPARGPGRDVVAWLNGTANQRPCLYRPARVYSVQPGRTRPGVMSIRITAVRQERLGAITHEDAVREGFKSTWKFFATWELLHDEVDRDQLVWVISFERLPEQPALFLARGLGYTTDPKYAMGDGSTEPPAARLDSDDEGGGIDLVRCEPEAVRPYELAELGDELSELRQRLVAEFEGQEPADILALEKAYRTTADIEKMRRSMRRRAIDGLPELTPEQEEWALGYIVRRDGSVREVARALDCSVGQAHKLMKRAKRELDAA